MTHINTQAEENGRHGRVSYSPAFIVSHHTAIVDRFSRLRHEPFVDDSVEIVPKRSYLEKPIDISLDIISASKLRNIAPREPTNSTGVDDGRPLPGQQKRTAQVHRSPNKTQSRRGSPRVGPWDTKIPPPDHHVASECSVLCS